MKKTIITQLIPKNRRKSFYGNANVVETEDGTHYLMSYATIVASVSKSGKVHRYWEGKPTKKDPKIKALTKSTSIHLKSFFETLGCKTTLEDFKKLKTEEFNGFSIKAKKGAK